MFTEGKIIVSKIAICPGSFDPITNGHLDIIKRAAKLFDKVIVLVLPNVAKKENFTIEERVDFIIRSIDGADNIVVDCYDGLLAQYAKEHNANTIVKGLRAVSDFEYEFQMALTNKKIYKDIDTLFLPADEHNMYLSSSIVRQVAGMGGNISDFVPKEIEADIIKKLKRV